MAKVFQFAVLAAISPLLLVGCSGLNALPGIETLVAPAPKADPTALKAGSYSLDPAHAFLDFSLNHMGLSELKGRFDNFSVTLDVAEDVTASKLVAEIDVSSLFLSSEAFSKTLKSTSWFDADAYPIARFEAENISLTGNTTGTVTCTLSLHGTSAPVTLNVTFNGGADVLITGKYTVGFTATGVFRRSDFGIDKYTALVSDDVTLRFSGEFHRVSGV